MPAADPGKCIRCLECAEIGKIGHPDVTQVAIQRLTLAELVPILLYFFEIHPGTRTVNSDLTNYALSTYTRCWLHGTKFAIRRVWLCAATFPCDERSIFREQPEFTTNGPTTDCRES
jgi:hypothetical protein